MPAAPVPDDHVEMTLLFMIQNRKIYIMEKVCSKATNTYLLKFGAYVISDDSPNPQLNDVNTMPAIACHSSFAFATAINPNAEKKVAMNIRKLKTQ